MNLANAQQGAEVIGTSSEVAGCEAGHILTDDLSQIWLSEDGIPQWICLSLFNIPHQEDTAIRSIGWHCWHAYSTNPKEIRVHVSHDGIKFKIWDSLIVTSATQRSGTQLFCCDPIYIHIYPYLAFEIMSTYGGTQTYLNQIYLYSEEIALTSSTLLTSEDDSLTAESEQDSPNRKNRIPKPRRRPSNSGSGGKWTQFPTTLSSSNVSSVTNSPNRGVARRSRTSSHTSELSDDSLLSLSASPMTMKRTLSRTPSVQEVSQLPVADLDLVATPQELLASIDSLTNNTSLLVEKLQQALGLNSRDEAEGDEVVLQSNSSTPKIRSRTNSQSPGPAILLSPQEMEAKLLGDELDQALFGSKGSQLRSRSNSPVRRPSLPGRLWESDSAIYLQPQDVSSPRGILKASPIVTFNPNTTASPTSSSKQSITTNIEELLVPRTNSKEDGDDGDVDRLPSASNVTSSLSKSSASKAESLLSDRNSMMYQSMVDPTSFLLDNNASSTSSVSNDVRLRLLELEHKLHSIQSMVQLTYMPETSSRNVAVPEVKDLQVREEVEVTSNAEEVVGHGGYSLSSSSVASESSWLSAATSTSSYAPISPTMSSKPFPLPEDIVYPPVNSSSLLHTSKSFARSTSPSKLRHMLGAINKLKEEMEAELRAEQQFEEDLEEQKRQASSRRSSSPASIRRSSNTSHLDRSTSIGSLNHLNTSETVVHKATQATPSPIELKKPVVSTSPSRLVLREMAVQADPYTEMLEAASQLKQAKTSHSIPSSSSPTRLQRLEADYLKLRKHSRNSAASTSYLSEDEHHSLPTSTRRLHEQDLHLHDIPSRNQSTEDIMEQMLENIRHKARVAADEQYPTSGDEAQRENMSAERIATGGRRSRSPSPTRLRASVTSQKTLDERIDDEITAMREKFFHQHVSGSALKTSQTSLPPKPPSRSTSPSFRQSLQSQQHHAHEATSSSSLFSSRNPLSSQEPKLIPTTWSIEQKIRDMVDRSLHQAAAANTTRSTSNTTNTTSTSRSNYLLVENRREVTQYGDEDLEKLVQELHAKVLQRTVKEAQLRILSQQHPASH